MEEIRCYGCGAIIQNENKKMIGYVPKSAMNNEVVLCQRCFRLKNYHELNETNLTQDDFLNILQTIGDTNSLVVYMIDLFDFNGSLIPGLTRHLSQNDILIVGNKRDILPKSAKDQKIIKWLRRQLKEYGIKPVDVLLTSGIKKYNVDTLIEMIEHYRNKRDVYVVGVTNVGKSSMINTLIKSINPTENNLITTSEFPGTTLDLIEIPFDDHSSLYDSPGIINKHQIAHIIEKETLKEIMPTGELRPATFQLDNQQTLYFGGLARIDFIKGKHSSFTCYFNRRLTIHRTKLINADELYNRHKTLKPTLKQIESIKDFANFQFKLPDYKVDIVISGLGFISVHSPDSIIKVKAPHGVGVFIREALI
ncbi:ribosome biogenesis GTPase YqeH [Coprobacillus sp. AF33-1AC]|uniref:ribosome biogenesis GTPase YqeH n=1 Tax=Coprobacillus sp. AF33-1AC TaxID=2292032 RepID=UPI000E46A5D7|nr:ribosome biogenesis GTPase YqeH [Coprobacillus sp. AF33-1AC]RHM63660.1 ribosome biogenesis GTPase YqeH [Coprobacillus sp. AF33-1AC]